MRNFRKKRVILLPVLLLTLGALAQAPARAGSLEPPGPPAPTMKTLVQVEPRTPLDSSTTPGDGAYSFIISAPGSYYLTGNLNTSMGGIRIDVDDVTIDLGGFTMTGPGNGAHYGIQASWRSNVEIRNGTIRNFAYGVYQSYSASKNNRVVDLRALSNSFYGIYLNSSGNLVRNCTAMDNGVSSTGNAAGIVAGHFSSITDNIAVGNGTSAVGVVWGISAGWGSTVSGNTVVDNGDLAAGSRVRGLDVGLGSTIIRNAVRGNGNGATGTVHGIFFGGDCIIDQNVATDNGGINMDTVYSGAYGTNWAP